ncbi:hypothetical protein ACA910_022007 [Epithemia clementina (nom. ined.)]
MSDKNPEIDPQKRAELNVVNRLMDAMTAKAQRLKDQYGQSSLNQFHLEPNEQQLLRKVNNHGLVEGLAAGVVALLALRHVRRLMLRKLMENQRKQQTSDLYQGSPSPMQQLIQQRQQGPHLPPNSSSPPIPPNGPYREGFFSYWFGWLVDGVLSFSVAAIVTVKAMNLEKMLGEISRIPLGPGKSTFSREFCPVVTDWMRGMEVESQNGDETMTQVLNHPKSKSVAHLLELARNCDRRMRYEQMLRKEKGVASPDFPVDIPPPGVPQDLDEASISLSPSSSSSSWTDEGESFSSQDSFESNSWAEGFVEDQEEESNRRRK